MLFLCIAVLFNLSACGGSEWIFSLNGEKLNKEDVAAFGCIYTMEYNIKDEKQLDEMYTNEETYGEYYKAELESDIISSVLLYKEAKENRVSISDKAKKQIKVDAEKLLERFGEDVLEKKGVSKTDIEKVYEMKRLGEAYLETISESKEGQSDVQRERYIRVYQVTFPTVELDDDGMVRTNEEGELKRLSTDAISEIKQEAIDFAEALKQGTDMEKLLEECESGITGAEKYLKYNDLEKDYKLAVDEMSVGDTSEVLESEYGFLVVLLLEQDDEEYADVIGNQEENSRMLSAKEDLLDELYSDYADENREYKNADAWNAIDMKDYIQ